MVNIEVARAIQAIKDVCNCVERFKEAILKRNAMGAFNMAEIMRDAQQAIGGDYEQCGT